MLGDEVRYYICVLILLNMRPHTRVIGGEMLCVLILLNNNMCPHTPHSRVIGGEIRRHAEKSARANAGIVAKGLIH